jgi:hypothetical protein
MNTFELHSVEYSPGRDSVRITVKPSSGPFRGQLHDLYASQQDLSKRCPDDRATWSDAECMAEAAAQLEKSGATLLAPEGENVQVAA